MPNCFVCEMNVASIAVLHTHLEFCSGMPVKFMDNFRCAEGGNCFKTFSRWNALKSHLISAHNCPLLGTKPPVVNSQPNVSNACNDISHDSYEHAQSEGNSVPENELPNISQILEDTLLEFVSKLYANHKFTRSHVVEIMKETSNVLISMLDILKPIIRKDIKGKSEADILSCIEEKIDYLVKPFVKFSSEYMYKKALQERNLFIDKKTTTLGAQVDHVRYKGKIIKKVVNVTAKFIPMRIVLCKLFSIPKVFSAVYAHVKKLNSETDMLENFVQGKLWKQKVQDHFLGKTVFPIFVYFDDFEVGNPLGSHAGINKLGGIYYSIPCFPPEVQSLLENIFVAGLFYSSDRAIFTNYNVFKTVIEELNYLQAEGITVDTENGPVKIYFALGLVLGDNLGLNQILGFQESFSAYHSCRFCQVNKYQMQYEPGGCTTRTSAMYDQDVAAANPRDTGIKERSVWDNVNFFKTCENYAVDYLHDGPEGALKKFMGLIVHYFSMTLKSSKDAGFLNVLNDRLNSFDYYHNCMKNKPPLISHDEAHDKQLKMSASEMQNFILIFSMLVGDIVPHDDSVWQFYLCIRKLVDLITARRIPKSWVGLMQEYTSELYTMYLNVFPNESVTIKLHNFSAHYKTVLEQSGPIAHLSTFRFESKHKKKKEEANATSSHKNIIETLTTKELLILANRFLLGHGFAPNTAYGNGKKVIMEKQPGYPSFKGNCPGSFHKSCTKMNWATINGQTYRCGSCVVIGIDVADEVLPVFGVISSVYRNDSGEILLVCRVLTSIEFDAGYYAYEVEETSSFQCVLVSNLISPFPVVMSYLNGCLYVTPRHTL